jgi:hypothetical protein
MYSRLALNSQSSFLSFLNAEITGMNHHVWPTLFLIENGLFILLIGA